MCRWASDDDENALAELERQLEREAAAMVRSYRRWLPRTPSWHALIMNVVLLLGDCTLFVVGSRLS